MFDGAQNGQEFEPLPFSTWWPALIMFAYVAGALIAVLMYG